MIARYWIVSGIRTDYFPRKGDIVAIDFNLSSGSEIRKRRPALAISNSRYSALTGLAVVCPITHAQNNRLRKTELFVGVKNDHVDGVVNPLQFHTFDYQTCSM
jgi:mRNA interferase MazF